jgi:hypothetical protein
VTRGENPLSMLPGESPLGGQVDLRESRRGSRGNCLEGFEPQLDSRAKWRDLDAGEGLTIAVETAQARSQQRNGSRAVVALKVVEPGSDLNQPLQKRPFRFLRREPHRFPVFVGFEEGAGMKASQAFV